MTTASPTSQPAAPMGDAAPPPLRYRDSIAFACVLVLAVAVRLPGLTSPVFTDEVHVIRAVAHFISGRTIMPPWFDWPPLMAYLATLGTGCIALLSGRAMGISPSDWALLESAFNSPGLLLGARMVSVLLMMSTVSFLFHMPLGRGDLLRRIAAPAVFVFSPCAITYGCWGLPESGVACGCAGALLYCLRFLDSGRTRDLVLAGAMSGVAAAFKYNGAFSVFAVAMAALLCPRAGGLSHSPGQLTRAAAASLAVFLLLTPTWILSPSQAMGGILFESRHVSTPRIGEFHGKWIGMLPFLARHEPGLLFALALALCGLAGRQRRAVAVLLTIPVVNLLVVGGWRRLDDNYFYPTFVAASPAAALGLATLVEALRTRSTVFRAAVTLGWNAFLALLFLQQFPQFYRPDNRETLNKWLVANLPPRATVVRDGAFSVRVWDPPELREFIQGRGRALSPLAWEYFDYRLAEVPTARRVMYTEPKPGDVLPLDFAESLEPGTWLLTNDLEIDRVLAFPRPPEPQLWPRWEGRKALYESLRTGRHGWRLAWQSIDGSGPGQYAYVKR